MKLDFQGWDAVADYIYELAKAPDSNEWKLNDGQRASLRVIANRLPENGILIADEVGMGKTRIAVAVARSVIAAGGRVAILVPPGLGAQWREDELRQGNVECPPILRSIWQYLQAWEAAEEKDQKPWFNENAVLISHAFTNWRLGENSSPWRWALLPELYAQWRKKNKGSFPRDFHQNEKLDYEWVKRAARSICAGIPKKGSHPANKLIRDLSENTPWPTALNATEYGSNENLRPWLERAVGLGLGVFDLVIIDEAHKSRNQDSGLSRLLDGVVLSKESSRRLAMTATPVEIDASQWKQTLERLCVDQEQLTAAIGGYAAAVQGVRQTPCDKQVLETFKQAAKVFQEGLAPYLLRRDKSKDPYVKKFAQAAQRAWHEYREELEIVVETAHLSSKWKHSVCAAESLAMVTRQSDEPVAKRLRLTLGNGHGIAALLDQVMRDSESDKQQEKHDGINFPENEGDKPFTTDKRQQRAQWWRDVICRAQPADDKSDEALYEHPAILAAIEAIESTCQLGEKVLVFGRFNRPLKALVDLLNAREMLRCLDAKRYWPQAKVHSDEWLAIQVAHRQLKHCGEIDQTQLNKMLSRQYQKLENLREYYRKSLINNIAEGLDGRTSDSRVLQMFNAFRKSEENGQLSGHDGSLLALIARAMQELTGLEIESLQPQNYADAFIDLIDASTDRDEGDTNADGTVDEEEAADLWETVGQRLREEYNRPQGGFARLMFGGTKPETRRLLQVAFNRTNCNPKVLVAQSMVGREGLNLHKACRTVVLLHPEWNPGVVEQQIGRVDRVGSLWEKLLDKAIEDKVASYVLPRIQIQPVIFKGTYDEKNWEVLRVRWDNLRAQLHGVIISPSIAEKYGNFELVNEINNAAPNFSPKAAKLCPLHAIT